MSEGIIRLEGLSFRGFHGVYPDEQVNGNDFLVDVEMHVDVSSAAASDQLRDTVDYANVYSLIRTVMEERRNLLEFLANRMAEVILGNNHRIRKISVTVSKLHPDIGGTCARTAVTVSKEQT